MYDPIHDRYTSVANDETKIPSKAKDEEDYEEEERRYGSSETSNHLHYDRDRSADRRRENNNTSSSASPQRKRKRDHSPYERPQSGTPDIKGEQGTTPTSQLPAHPSDQNGSEGQSQELQVGEQERKRMKRYEGEKDRTRRLHGQQKEIKAGPFARREVVLRDEGQSRPFDRRNPAHRRSPPHFKYRDPPPPPHIALDPKFKDPEPEILPERPRSPPKRFKRPGARYSEAEREALHKQQHQKEAETERKGADAAASRGVDEVVRSHYNAVPERGKQWRRTDSKIRGLRSFNNWVKSTLIQKFAANEDYQPSQRYESGLKVLDIGCGKGGDLLKWKSAPQPVELYVGVDSAEVSVRQAKDRFVKMNEEERRRNRGRSTDRFHAEFFVLDAWSDRVDDIGVVNEVGVDLNVGPREGWPQGGSDRWNGGGFDVVSLMFCMHYAFESEEKIRGMLRNVSGSLRRGGRFIGTIPSSDVIYSFIQKEGSEFGNSLYKVSFPKTEAARKLPDDGAWRPAWGWKYSFFLEESVEDVPEYVVPWEAFRGLAFEYNLKLEYKRLFEDIWNDEKDDRILGPLSERMNVKKRDGSGELQVEAEEWEACKIYMGFCFRKI